MQEKVDRIEKFSVAELANLRAELMRSGLDSRQAAEILSTFLIGRGYGVDSQRVTEAALRMERSGCTTDCMQAELESVALIM
ncbi:hypothetical protein [Acidobacterium capsulatum]|nr:hypothetical protein [Acidobacterium capsulatum]HCT59849.1 hypothetical protein [Acidobacterium sp.]